MEAQTSVLPLQSYSTALYAVKNEKPEHRMMLYMRAAGMSSRQIANALGVHYMTVNNLLKQPWARKLYAEIVESKGGNLVEEFLKAHGPDAAQTIVDIMNDVTAKREVRQKSAFFILDKIVADKLDVIRTQNLPPAQLDQQLQIIEEQIKEIENGQSIAPSDDAPTDEAEITSRPNSEVGVAQTA